MKYKTFLFDLWNNKTFDPVQLRIDTTDALSQLIHDQDISVDKYNATLYEIQNAYFPLPRLDG